MVDVTRSNYESLIPQIISQIKSSTFVAIDAEFTGIFAENKSLNVSNSLFDSASVRYAKLRKNLEKYMICQLGIAIFHKNPEQNEFNVEAYNIYLYPVSFDNFCKRDAIHIQVSCGNFLGSNQFDFNKFIKEGAPYLNKEKVKDLEKYLRGTRHFLSTCELIDPYYFPETFKECITDSKIPEIIQRLKGISNVIDALHECGKPIVGHNVLQDLLLLYQQFWKDLPDTYNVFKKEIVNLFPTIFDTKVIAWEVHMGRRCTTNPGDKLLADTNLFKLYSNLSSLHDFNTPLIVPNEGTGKYRRALQEGFKKNLETVKDASCHEAAFDAVVTGAVFIKLTYLSCRPASQVWDTRVLAPTTAELFSGVMKYKNAVNLARANIRHLILDGSDPVSTRPDYIRVKNIKGVSGLSQAEVRRHLTRFGDVEIIKLDSNSLLLACTGIACSRNVWNELQKRGYRLSKEKYHLSSTGYMLKEYGLIFTLTMLTGGISYWVGLKLLKYVKI